MKNTIIFLLLTFAGCSSVTKKPEEITKIQLGLLKSGITPHQCKMVTQELAFPVESCQLVIKQYEPFIKKATEIISKVPPKYKDKSDNEYIEKTSVLLKEFPSTTEKEIVNSLEEEFEYKSKNNQNEMPDEEDDRLDVTDGCNPSPYVSGCGPGGLIQRREKLEKRNNIMKKNKVNILNLRRTLKGKLKTAFREKPEIIQEIEEKPKETPPE